jgi:hypothetical protein
MCQHQQLLLFHQLPSGQQAAPPVRMPRRQHWSRILVLLVLLLLPLLLLVLLPSLLLHAIRLQLTILPG